MQLNYIWPRDSQELTQRIDKFLTVPVGELRKKYNDYYINEFVEKSRGHFIFYPEDQNLQLKVELLRFRIKYEYPEKGVEIAAKIPQPSPEDSESESDGDDEMIPLKVVDDSRRTLPNRRLQASPVSYLVSEMEEGYVRGYDSDERSEGKLAYDFDGFVGSNSGD